MLSRTIIFERPKNPSPNHWALVCFGLVFVLFLFWLRPGFIHNGDNCLDPVRLFGVAAVGVLLVYLASLGFCCL